MPAKPHEEENMTSSNATSGLAQRMAVRQVEASMTREKAAPQESKPYEDAIREFLKDSGHLICVSDDVALTDMLRRVLNEQLGLPADKISIAHDADMLLRILRNVCSENATPLLLIEQSLKGRDFSYMVRLIKNGFPEVRVVFIAAETEQQRYVLLHEAGADAFFAKPDSQEQLLERLAATVRPHGKMSRMLEWARTLMAQGEHLRALQVCKQALDLKANSAAALLLIGDIFRAMQQYDKACEAYENASRTSSMYLEPLRKLAEVYADTGNTAKQLACLERLDELSPLNVERKLTIGELYLQLNRPENAKKIFDQAMLLSDREATEYVSGVAFRVADVYMDKDPQTAASFLQRGLEAKKGFWGPEDMLTFNRVGILLRRAGKWREAAEEYLKALKVAPNDENLHYNLGMAYLEGKDFEAARSSTLKALALNPDLPRKSSLVASNLATVFVQTGDNMHALPLLRLALEQDPGNGTARDMLAQVGQADQTSRGEN